MMHELRAAIIDVVWGHLRLGLSPLLPESLTVGNQLSAAIKRLTGAYIWQVQAACCGLYALRPSPTACDRTGMVGLAGPLDAPAFMAQTADGLEGFVRALQLPGGTAPTLS